jgi:hypothetical protein
MLHFHATCPCCMFTQHVLDAFPCYMLAACPCCMSLLYVCPCCKSLLHVLAACLCTMLHVNVAFPSCLLMLHAHEDSPCCVSMLHVWATCLCCMSMLAVKSVHTACPCCISISTLYVRAACPCKCYMSLKWKAARSCCLYLLHSYAACAYRMSTLHATYLSILLLRAACLSVLCFISMASGLRSVKVLPNLSRDKDQHISSHWIPLSDSRNVQRSSTLVFGLEAAFTSPRLLQGSRHATHRTVQGRWWRSSIVQ